MDDTYYQILDIENGATKNEIRKAYRRLSMQWHPDKNQTTGAEDKFKQIGKAYEILSDESKKKEYDRNIGIGIGGLGGLGGMGGLGGLGGMGGLGGINGLDFNLLKDIFMQNKDLFNKLTGNNSSDNNSSDNNSSDNNNFPFNFNQNFNTNTDNSNSEPNYKTNSFFGFMQRPIPIIKTINISMEDAYHGISYPLLIKRWIITNQTKEYEEETIYVDIPEGIDDNEIIKFREKGNIINDKLKGDIKIFIKIEKEAPYLFKRKGLDLYYNKTIGLKEALCGFSFQLDHINGESYQINNKDTIITPNYTKTVTKLGIKRDGRVGNLIINFTLIFPEELSNDIKEKLRDILV